MKKIVVFLLFCFALVSVRPVLATPQPNDPVAYSVITQLIDWVAGTTGNPNNLKTDAKTLTGAINELYYTAGEGISITQNENGDKVISLAGLPENPDSNSIYVYQNNQLVDFDLATDWNATE